MKEDREKTAFTIPGYGHFPVPKNKKQERRFLGMTGWYRRFISNFASLSAPLTDSLQGGPNSIFTFSPEAEEAFEKLKVALTSAPILSNPDFSLPFIIQCDASTTGISAVLSQVYLNGDEKVIYYHSQKLNRAQRNYSITELECLAAISWVQKFRPFIELQEFQIITDHASLQWLIIQKELSGRLARWSLKLQAFDFTIVHRKGSEHVVPDALSRAYSVDSLDTGDLFFGSVDLQDPEFYSSEYKDLIITVEQSKKLLPDISISDGYLYKKVSFTSGNPLDDDNSWKLWIPNKLTENLIRISHNPPSCSHGGIAKTLNRLKRWYYWPNMALHVTAVVDACEVCKGTKASNTISRPPMGKQIIVDHFNSITWIYWVPTHIPKKGIPLSL